MMTKNTSKNIQKKPQDLNLVEKSKGIRIIAGHLKQKKIAVLNHDTLRPTPERLREALFNSLGQNLQQVFVLDLFAGSGALAFEAYSRGAHITAIENETKNFQAMQKLAKSWALDMRWHALRQDAFIFITQTDLSKFNIILLDPPYDLACVPDLFQRIFQNIYKNLKMNETADFKILIYCEHHQKIDFININTSIQSIQPQNSSNLTYHIKKEWKMGQVYAYLTEWIIKI